MWVWAVDHFDGASFFNNVLAGLVIMVIDFLVIAILLGSVAHRIEKRIQKNLWRPTREQLTIVLLHSAERVMGATQAFMQPTNTRVYTMVGIETQIARIVLALDALNSQSMLHIPSFDADIARNVSKLVQASDGVRENSASLPKLYRAIRDELKPFDEIDGAQHVAPHVFIVKNGRIVDTIQATSMAENSRRHFSAALITLSVDAQQWAKSVVEYAYSIKAVDGSEERRSIESICRRIEEAERSTRSALQHGLWLAEYRKSRDELEAAD